MEKAHTAEERISCIRGGERSRSVSVSKKKREAEEEEEEDEELASFCSEL